MVAQLLVAVLTTALKSCLRAEWWTSLFAHGRSQENVFVCTALTQEPSAQLENHGFEDARPRQRRPEPSTAEHELIQMFVQSH